MALPVPLQIYEQREKIMKASVKTLMSAVLLCLITACGSSSVSDSTSALFVEAKPCGDDNGIPKFCRTDRVTEYTVNVDNLLRFTQCGSKNTWPGLDPYVSGLCGGVNAGQFVTFGPYLTIREPGQIVARIHLLPNKLIGSWPNNYSPAEPMFAVDIYSATLGGSLSRPDPFDYSDFGVVGTQGAQVYMGFQAPSSPLAVGKKLPEGFKVVEITGRVNSPITDLEVRVQSIHRDMSVSVLAVEITHIRD